MSDKINSIKRLNAKSSLKLDLVKHLKYVNLNVKKGLLEIKCNWQNNGKLYMYISKQGRYLKIFREFHQASSRELITVSSAPCFEPD